METALLRCCVSFSGHSYNNKNVAAAHHRVDGETPRSKSSPGRCEDEWCAKVLSRRSVLASSGFSLASLVFPGDGFSVVKQGLLAGRVPGLSEPDDEGSFFLCSFLSSSDWKNPNSRTASRIEIQKLKLCFFLA